MNCHSPAYSPKSMPFPRKELPSNPPANSLASQSTQQQPPRQQPYPAKSQSHQQNYKPQLVCTWSAHTTQSGPSPSLFPRNRHTLTATATAAYKLFLFGGYESGPSSSDIYVFSTQDFSTTILKTSGKVPTPRTAHSATLIGTTLLICGGKVGASDQNVLDNDSLYLLNLGTSDIFMSSLTPADHSFALQYHESGPALWSMVPDRRAVIATIRQPWSVPSFSSLVARLTRRGSSTICGHSI